MWKKTIPLQNVMVKVIHYGIKIKNVVQTHTPARAHTHRWGSG